MNIYYAKAELALVSDGLPVEELTFCGWRLDEFSVDELKRMVAVLHARQVCAVVDSGHKFVEVFDSAECVYCGMNVSSAFGSRCKGEVK